MNKLLYLLFSFKGRITRPQYFGGFLLQVLLMTVIPLVGFAIIGVDVVGLINELAWNVNQYGMEIIPDIIGDLFTWYGGMMFILALNSLMTIWIGLAIEVKRWHDMNIFGGLVILTRLLMLVPIIQLPVAIVVTFILLFVPGTRGPNNYGDDPASRTYYAPAPQPSMTDRQAMANEPSSPPVVRQSAASPVVQQPTAVDPYIHALKMRLVNGEITREEYDRIKAQMEGLS
ncbi:MAG: hypothetical protein A2Z14_13325 [Chloroflexi bacterium RBG_16_48_8]|nr:MAG: hypothetical protein A2Z14_13325 [Chloroflexi bacterium RBG_16_48_8]